MRYFLILIVFALGCQPSPKIPDKEPYTWDKAMEEAQQDENWEEWQEMAADLDPEVDYYEEWWQ